jgi:hypothetical protein
MSGPRRYWYFGAAIRGLGYGRIWWEGHSRMPSLSGSFTLMLCLCRGDAVAHAIWRRSLGATQLRAP